MKSKKKSTTQQIYIGEPLPTQVKGRMLVKIPKDSLGPSNPKEDKYREYNKYGTAVYWREVECQFLQ